MTFRGSRFNLRQDLSTYLLSGKEDTRHSQAITRVSASGGTIFTPGNGFKYHIFTAPGSFIVGNGGLIDYVIIGGGGGGGGTNPGNANGSGGGGAGGYRTQNDFRIPAGIFTVSIGGGGTVVTNGTPSFLSGPPTFTTITALGGGAGGTSPFAGASGGSGGGGGSPGGSGGAGASGQGNPGGSGAPTNYISGGGGGGAGQVGGSGPGSQGSAGVGGNGLAAFQGDTGIPPAYGVPGPSPGRWFAGGGSGGVYPSNTGFRVSGGIGGGGAGGAYANLPGLPGTTNTGGGGGGASYTAGGGSGGSGIVIIRYRL